MVIAVYVGLTGSYTFWLKHVAVIDIAVVASGFILRAIAGGVATHLPISQWFLIVASFGSLFVVAGKRYAEHREMGDDRGDTRSILGAVLAPLPPLRLDDRVGRRPSPHTACGRSNSPSDARACRGSSSRSSRS